MTLAEALSDHLQATPAKGYGSILSAEFTLAAFVRSRVGSAISVADNVSIAFLAMPDWTTAPVENGVRLQFTRNKPKVRAQAVVHLEADIGAIVIRTAGTNLRITLELDRFPDFDVEVKL